MVLPSAIFDSGSFASNLVSDIVALKGLLFGVVLRPSLLLSLLLISLMLLWCTLSAQLSYVTRVSTDTCACPNKKPDLHLAIATHPKKYPAQAIHEQLRFSNIVSVQNSKCFVLIGLVEKVIDFSVLNK